MCIRFLHGEGKTRYYDAMNILYLRLKKGIDSIIDNELFYDETKRISLVDVRPKNCRSAFARANRQCLL